MACGLNRIVTSGLNWVNPKNPLISSAKMSTYGRTNNTHRPLFENR